MVRSRDFRILIASDGSLSATAAVTTARRFPWPEGTIASGVIARENGDEPARVRDGLERVSSIIAESTETALRKRWPDARVRIVDGPVAAAIVRHAKGVRADVIVMGWRGHGTLRRLLAGSVSRAVVRSAPCSVLVVRRAMPDAGNVVLGFDGSAESRRAMELLARLQPPKEGRVLLVTAAETLRMPSQSLMPSDVRRRLSAEVASTNRRRVAAARAALEAAATTLRASGWRTQSRVTDGDPLRSLLDAVTDRRANLLVAGARGVSGVERMLLGSVAEGALNHCPVPVLIAR
jgi:nucleotide-binding universal stress UspA family protein